MSDTAKRGVQALAVILLFAVVAGVLTFRTAPTLTAARNTGDRRGLVESYLRHRANDPGSVEIQQVRYGIREKKDGVIEQTVRVEFREKNAFGALVFRDILLTIENDRTVRHGELERHFMGIANSMEWSSDPSGPKH